MVACLKDLDATKADRIDAVQQHNQDNECQHIDDIRALDEVHEQFARVADEPGDTGEVKTEIDRHLNGKGHGYG
ncbi:hypothetical protein AUJ68_03940 [Candidatus Woesearchaeota archaeon CG1_02_57_44]|nr:MAG: hypothetical protein AUJ68_03940 [Candidatus Woesearchaeota archaeon CG1_02_57_44]